MKKMLFLFFISVHFIQAQEKVLEFGVTLDKNPEVFNVVDETTGSVVIFTLQGRQLKAFSFDDNFRKIGAIEPAKIPDKYDIFSGYIIKDKEVQLFMSNTKRDKFAKIFFDFTSGESSFNEMELDIDGEKFLESISHKDNFIIFTLPNDSEVIKVYNFDKGRIPTITTVDFSDANYLNERNRPAQLGDLVFTHEGFSKVVDIAKMENNEPNSIQEASKNVKTFTTGNKLTIALDENHYFTYLLEIDLNDFKGKVKRIEKPRLSEEWNHKSSNSFLLNDRLYQVVTSNKALKFHIVDIESGGIINSHRVNKDEEIYFKNTPIIQEGGVYTSHREYNKTAKFIRKMKNLPIAITATEKDGVYQISMGSSLEKQAAPMMNFGMAGGAMGGVVHGMTVGFNPMVSVYLSYGYSRTVEITGLFDENYEHMEGDIEPHIFDGIKEFSEKYKHISSETLFKKRDEFYWGYYDNYNKIYNFYKM